jgi:DNA helicase-2/ATP-dependent DNA helicase PcrA
MQKQNSKQSENSDVKSKYLKLKRALFDRAYSSLNVEQRRAVFSVRGPLLVLAGAGSGKTTVLIKRIVHIIKFGDAYESDFVPDDIDENTLLRYEYALSELTPEEIEEQVLPEFASSPCPPWAMLAITFTNKAAGEIKNRLAAALEKKGENGQSIGDSLDDTGIWAGTFHSICVRILRKYGEHVGCRSGFTIYDTDDSKKVISESMKALHFDERTLPIKTVMNEISRAKDRLETAEKYAANVGADFRLSRIAQVYKMYEERLAASNAVDFDDIILKTVTLLSEHDDIRDYYRRRFRYISVDEYQDTNHAQFVLVNLLTGEHRNLMVVGDDDQSIYKFRGATIENILTFDSCYEDARIVRLEQNYRSTLTILEAANSVIANNTGRKGKRLWTAGENGEKIKARAFFDQNREADFICRKISELVESGFSYRDIAVLYRVNAQSAPLEMAFSRNKIPHRLLGALRFFERKEVRDILAYISLAQNPHDNLRLKRIINEPKRKIGAMTIETAELIAAAEGTSIYNIISSAKKYPALLRAVPALKDFVTLIETLREFARTSTVAELIDRTVELSGYRDMLLAAGEAEADRLENIDALISMAVDYDKNEDASLEGFLEEVALISDVDKYDETADAVVLMTIHSSKGLEFPVVFLPGMEENIFPGQRSIQNDEDIEEERRLAYVAITRAKKQLYMTYARQRSLYGYTLSSEPSRFLREINKDCIEFESKYPVKNGTEFDYFESDSVIERGYGSNYGQSSRARRLKTGVNGSGGVRSNGSKASYLFTSSLISRKNKPSSPKYSFKAGDIVVHSKFGRGEVLTVRDFGGDTMYEIVFDEVGTKKLMASYANLTSGE